METQIWKFNIEQIIRTNYNSLKSLKLIFFLPKKTQTYYILIKFLHSLHYIYYLSFYGHEWQEEQLVGGGTQLQGGNSSLLWLFHCGCLHQRENKIAGDRKQMTQVSFKPKTLPLPWMHLIELSYQDKSNFNNFPSRELNGAKENHPSPVHCKSVRIARAVTSFANRPTDKSQPEYHM